MNNKKGIKIAVYIAILAVIGSILNLIEIPYFIPYLKLDISEVVTLIAASISLPIAIGVAIVKAFIMSITGTSSGFIGEATLLIGSFTIIIFFTLFKNKMKMPLVMNLVLTSLCFTIIMTGLNYFIITPFYFGTSFSNLVNTTQPVGSQTYSYFIYIIIVYLPFNLLKMLIDSTIFYFISKKLKKVLVG